MDKNTIIGFLLMGAVLIGFTYYSTPSPEQIQEQQLVDSLNQEARVKEAEAEALAAEQAAQQREEALQDTTSALFNARHGESRNIVLENDLVKLTFNTFGGMLQKAELKNFKNQQKENVILFSPEDTHLSLALDAKTENILTNELYFEVEQQTNDELKMRVSFPNHAYLEFAYRLRPDSYMLDFVITPHNMGNMFSTSTKTMNIVWESKMRQQEKGFNFENRYACITYHEWNGGVDDLSETSNDEEQLDETLDWVAFKTQFFSAILIGQQQFNNVHLASTLQEKGSGYLKHYEAEMATAFDPSGKQPTELQFFLGPNDFHLLQQHSEMSLEANRDLELEDIVDLGWPIIRWVNRFFIIYLFDWLSGFGLHMGLVLLLLTLIVKAIVYPPTKKSFMASARMRVLKPHIDELNAKYPKQEDAMKKQQEMMQLYSQYGVNPMGGCLPMLIQMPIWIALFNFIPNAIEMRGQRFLWADDLSSYDAILQWDHSIWLIGDHISLFCILFCAVQIINTWISMRQQAPAISAEQAQQMKIMRWMMYLMPLMFFFMFNEYSSGLSYYYFISGLINILTMWFLRATTDDAKLLAKLEAYKAKHANDPKKSSGLAARLEAMQRQAQAMEEQRRKK